MKLLDYIRGLRKGKEAHRLEKESMKDPFLADAMDGYHEVEEDPIRQIEKLRTRISDRTSPKKNLYAIGWSIAACLVIGIGISTYFLSMKKSLNEEVFLAKEEIPPLPEVKIKQDSTHEITVTEPADKKDRIAGSRSSVQKVQRAPAAASVASEEVTVSVETEEETVVATDTDLSSPDREQLRRNAAVLAVHPLPADTARPLLANGNEDKQELPEAAATGDGNHKKTPQPVNGERKYKKYLRRNLIRPKDDLCKDVKGKVTLTFRVNKEGSPYHITVVEGLCESADQEAIRLVKEGPKWTYGNLPAQITIEF